MTRQPCPRQGKYRSHGDAHRSPIQRIRTRGVDEHGIKSQSSRGAKGRTDIGVVDDSFEHQDATGACHTSCAGGSARRCITARAPRCTRYPVTSFSTFSLPT